MTSIAHQQKLSDATVKPEIKSKRIWNNKDISERESIFILQIERSNIACHVNLGKTKLAEGKQTTNDAA